MSDPFRRHKILAHLPILSQYVEGKAIAPILVEIDLTNMCASACPWCAGYLNRKWSNATLFAGSGTATARLQESVSGVKRLLQELVAAGVKAVTWTGGGDPTQHKGLEEVVEFAASLGLKQALITHGVVEVSHLLHHLEWVRFSVDGATVEGYGEQHGKPKHFERVIGNVSLAADRKARESLTCTVGVGFLTHRGSWHEIVPFAKLWRGIPVDYIQFRPLHDTHGSVWQSDDPNVLSLIEKAKKVDSRVTCSESKYIAIAAGERGKTKRCHGIYFETAISADGLVYTCCHHKGNKEFAIGDLTRESFADIWERHQKTTFTVGEQCPAFCRHYGTNSLIDNEILAERTHAEFI